MSDDDSSLEPEIDIAALYVTQFRQHLCQVQAHLAGTDSVRLPPSYIPPTGYWTAEEKDKFFHALSVHSRFRPDLIAARIETKTILDVSVYIDALRNALSRDQSLSALRSDLECAMEVSDSWVRWEEGNAHELVDTESKWEEETLEQQQEEMSAKSALADVITAPENACAGPETRESDPQLDWKQENALKQLDSHHLRVLESFLRQAESGIANSDPDEVQPEDHQCQSIPIVPISPLPVIPPTQAPSCSAISDDMIDPVLLRLSQSNHLPQPGTTALEVMDQSLSTLEPLSLLARNTPPPSPPPYITLPHPQPGGSSRVPVGQTDPSNLTPVSRRRFQKRLYMRRKRAEQKGEEVIVNLAKLRPGRKIKERKPPKQRPKSYKTRSRTPSQEGNEDNDNTAMDIDASPHTIPTTPLPGERSSSDAVQAEEHNADGSQEHEEQEETENSDDNDEDRHKRHSTGGLTKHYKIKKKFTENGIDGKTLIEGNLGLFHLSSLGRFMTLYKSGYDKSTTATATAVSSDTIRLLTVIIEEFTSEVVHRTIISREQDKMMKGGIKVYGRSHDEVTPENVEYVLEMMGMKGLTKEKYFAQLLGENVSGTLEVENDAEGQRISGNEGQGSSANGGEEQHATQQSTVYPALLPLHRELHPPLIYLGESLTSPTEIVPSMDEEVCMPMHTDEEDLEEELREEHDLDEEDSRLARQYEVDLWQQFGLEHKYHGTRKGAARKAGN